MNHHIFHKVPPAPALLRKICCTKRLISSGAGLSQFKGKEVLDIATYSKIITRPRATQAHTLVSPAREFAPVTGTVRALVLLVDFPDNESSEKPEHFKKMLFSKGAGGTGSLRDYYQEVSYGNLDVNGDVYGWYRAPHPYSYYTDGEYGFGDPPNNVQQLVKDVVEAAKDDVDFSKYDLNGDGEVDALFIVHAGPGAEETSNVNHIWSHRWGIIPVEVNDVRVSGYTMEPENGNIGVFCHELGHNFDLPDLYDADYNSHGIGNWCLMAGGSWNNGGKTPAHMSSWCKYKLGWVDPQVTFDAGRSATLTGSASNADMLKLPVGHPSSKEYFLLENRHKEGFDNELPGAGLLIWHVDENQLNNLDQSHYLVALEQADGLFELENNGIDSGDGGDPFPGVEGNRNFTSGSTPDSGAYDGTASDVSVTNISNPGSSMSFDVHVGVQPITSVLGGLLTKEIEGVGASGAQKLSDIGITTVAHLAGMDVLAQATGAGQNVIRLFDYKARAQLVAEFELDLAPFDALRGTSLVDILKESGDQLIQMTGQPETAIELLKDKLAQLSSALDSSTIKRLTLAEVG